MPASQQIVHVDAALTNISVDFSNNGNYLSERIAPILPVQKESDFYFYASKEKLRRFNTTMSPGADFPRMELDWDKRGWYFADGHGLEIAIPDQLRANADPAAQLDIQATRFLTESLLIDQEFNLSQNILGATNLAAAGVTTTTLSGGTQWSDYVNSNPLQAIDDAKPLVANAIAKYPNSLAINDATFLKLRNHPIIKDAVKYTRGGLWTPLSADELRQAFGLQNLYVGTPRYNSAHEGATDALSPLWGKNAYLFYCPDSPGLMEPAFMYTFLWTGQGFGQLIARYREQWRTQDVLQIQKYYTQQIVTAGAGYVFLNCIA